MVVVPVNAQTHQQFCEDMDYLHSHWVEIRGNYPDHYVAVYKGAVVAACKTLKKVLKELDKKGVPRNVVALRYIAQKPMRMIL